MWRSASALVILIALLFAAACGDGGEREGIDQTPSQPEVAGSESDLVRLVRRMFSFRYPGAPDPGEIQVLAGRLPDELPVELPMPDGAEVVGSVARGDENVDIVLDVPGAPESVLDAYGERLAAAGWREPELEGPPGGGFVPADGTFANVFCQEEKEGPYLSVSAFRLDNGDMSDIRLSLNSSSEGFTPCDERFAPGPPEISGLIPRLEAPRDATLLEGGEGGGGSNSWYSSSTLKTEMSVAEIEEHYRAQLEDAGWDREDSGAGGPAAWSTWTFTDDDGDAWIGLFLALDLPAQEDTRFLCVRVQRPGGEGAGTITGSGSIQFISP